jgi:hypothetical protein
MYQYVKINYGSVIYMKNIFLIICCFLIIFTGCFNVEARKEYETYRYYSSPVPLPYFSTVQRAPYYDDEFWKYTYPYAMEATADNPDFNNPYTIKEIYTLEDKLLAKRNAVFKDDPYKLMAFKDIRFEVADKSKLSKIQDVKYTNLFAIFMLEKYDIQNEKDFLQHWIKIQDILVTHGDRTGFDSDDRDANKLDLNNCKYRSDSNKWILGNMFQIPTFGLSETKPRVLNHIWNTYLVDGEWWSSDWEQNFIANVAFYIGKSPAKKDNYDEAVKLMYKEAELTSAKYNTYSHNKYPAKLEEMDKEEYNNRVAWLIDYIYEDGNRSSFYNLLYTTWVVTPWFESILYARQKGGYNEDWLLEQTLRQYSSGTSKYLSEEEYESIKQDILKYKQK